MLDISTTCILAKPFLALALVILPLVLGVIDISTERIMPLAEAANLLPRRRRGRKPHVSTLYRWISSGCRGERLESLRTPSGLFTSVEALQRFFERLSHKREAGETASTTRSVLQRQRASEAAAKELKKLGV